MTLTFSRITCGGTKVFIMLKDNYVILFVLICPIQDDLSMDGENPSRLSLGLHVGEHRFSSC